MKYGQLLTDENDSGKTRFIVMFAPRDHADKKGLVTVRALSIFTLGCPIHGIYQSESDLLKLFYILTCVPFFSIARASK
jgi:hypothetical protein